MALARCGDGDKLPSVVLCLDSVLLTTPQKNVIVKINKSYAYGAKMCLTENCDTKLSS